jgi:DNA-binding Lrp family transcriptional regulator
VVSCAALVACGGDDGGISVVPVPATVSIEVPTGRQALGVALQLRSSVGALAEGLDLRWDFGDGKTSVLSSPSHTYGAPGVYTVTLTVTNAAGDKVTGTSTVTVGDLAVAAGRVCNGPDQTGWCWQRPLPQGQTLNAFEFVSDAVGWAVGEGGTIMATRDGGKSWVAQRSGSALDRYDLAILRELQADARLSNAELAARSGLSAAPTWRRVRWLEAQGVITGYRAEIDRRKVGLGVLAFVRVDAERNNASATQHLEDRIRSLPEVVACGTTNAARAIRRPDIGTLQVGGVGEASIFEVREEPTTYTDVVGETLSGQHRFIAHGLVLEGRWWT